MLKTVSSIVNAIGALNYKGTWDANANSPALTSSVGTKGDYYVVGTAGSTTLNGISNWGVGDWAAFNGSVWQRVEGGANLNGVDLSVSGTSTLSALTASKPVFTNASKELTSSGTLGVDQGGTGQTTYTNGQLLIGNTTGNTLTKATLTAGGGIGITNGTGSVTIVTSSPTFSVYGNAVQTITTDVFTKVVLNTEQYDTNNNFDSTTNYRFTPTVAGYYQLNLKLQVSTTATLTLTIAEFRKNGTGANNGRAINLGYALGTFSILNATNIMYFNGSSDYCEIWVYLSGAGTLSTSTTDLNTTFFQGSMIRSA